MQVALERKFVSLEDYLAGEEKADIKHEFIGGAVYAMAGASTEHNQIALNIAFAARSHLKGRPCRVFMSDVKVRIEIGGEDIFYYPDVMIGCDSRDTKPLYLEFPRIIVEVSSKSTERLDRGEKFLAYQCIETLEEYLIVSQDRTEATIFRRSNKWQPEIGTGFSETIKLNSIALSLPLAAIYEGVSTAG